MSVVLLRRIGMILVMGVYLMFWLSLWSIAVVAQLISLVIDLILTGQHEDSISKRIRGWTGKTWDFIIMIALIVLTVKFLGDVNLKWWQLASILVHFTVNGHLFGDW